MGGCSAVCLCLYLSLLLPCRACSAFECLSLYIVRPRCDHLSRGASRAAHGAQYILKRLHVLQSLLELDPEWDAPAPATVSHAGEADSSTDSNQSPNASAATHATQDELSEEEVAEQRRAARGRQALEREQQHGLGLYSRHAVAFTR